MWVVRSCWRIVPEVHGLAAAVDAAVVVADVAVVDAARLRRPRQLLVAVVKFVGLRRMDWPPSDVGKIQPKEKQKEVVDR